MESDIVARLRQTHRVGCDCVGCEAADEIERLRTERDDAEPLLNELWERRTQSTEMRAEIERLRADRDAARAEVCFLRAANTNANEGTNKAMEEYAASRSWFDLFKDEDAKAE